MPVGGGSSGKIAPVFAPIRLRERRGCAVRFCLTVRYGTEANLTVDLATSADGLLLSSCDSSYLECISKLAAELASLDFARGALSVVERAEIAETQVGSAGSACSAANSATCS